jgi:cobalt-zinc-cadmium efflux system outer membrane protein
MVRATIVLALAACVAAPAWAQDGRVPSRLSLDDALRLAERHNPRLAAARAGIDLAGADAAAARVRPNPVLAIESQGYPLWQSPHPSFGDTQELTVRAEQAIDIAGVRRARARVGDLGVEAARAAADDEARRLRFDVRRAYLQVVLATADLSVARGTLEDLDKVLAINRARFAQGELSGVELRRLQVERLRFADDVLAGELARKTTGAALLALLGLRPLDAPFELTDGLDAPTPATPVVAALSDSLAGRPDVLAAQRLEARAGADVKAQAAMGTPAPTVGAGWQRNFGVNALVVGVTVPLPFFDRNHAGVARAEAEQRLARAKADEVATAALLEIQTATLAVESSRARVDYVEQEYLRNAREARDIVLASYRAGAAPLSDYLDAQRAMREAQRVRNRALFDYRVSLFQLDAALGRPAAREGESRP